MLVFGFRHGVQERLLRERIMIQEGIEKNWLLTRSGSFLNMDVNFYMILLSQFCARILAIWIELMRCNKLKRKKSRERKKKRRQELSHERKVSKKREFRGGVICNLHSTIKSSL